ncbi:hypothetical protein Pfo_019218 [Paulownia fortunei]|nr:hypothetical protein Pfo_019218 [Paulownia fortunei]
MVKQVLCLKMHPKPNQKLFFFIQATLLSIHFPGFLCQNYQDYATCSQPFQCGSISKISYPFWGGSRPLSCGYPGFELNCQGDVPLLNISSLYYRVLEFNFSTHTLKVARQDLWKTTCPTLLRNTNLNPHLFEIPPYSNDENVTLYFDCTNDTSQQQNTLPNQFSCDVNGVTTVNLFRTGDASSGPGTHITCNNNISVPVNQSASRALESPTASSINVLQDALAGGFFIQWSADNANCESCERSGGTCVYNRNSASTVCYKQDGGSLQVGPTSPAPVVYEVPQGPHPVQSSAQVGIAKALAVIFVILVAIIPVCIAHCLCSRGGPNQVSNQDIEKFLLQHGSLAPKRYKYSEIKKITKSFSDKLGQGGYGSVYNGVLPDGCLVAVKVLIESDSNGEEFINEVASISRTSHINIVNLLGFCYEGNKRALVYEFMPNKSLDKFISNSGSAKTDCHLDLEKLYTIAVGVAKGLEYLHTGCNTRIVHFDIKPQNILLDEDFCPKISDFGLAKLCKKKQSILSFLGTRGTIGYIAPEMFSRNFGGVSHKSDVYSYGMMVLEMAGAKTIIETEATQSSENCFPDKIYEQVILDVTRELDDLMIEEKEETARKMFLVGFWCVQTTPSGRPSMSKVVEMLEGSLQSIPIPPKPVLFTPTLPGQLISSSFSAYVETEDSAECIVET